MTGTAIILALASAVGYGLGLTLTQLGLRDVAPAAGAAISIPTSALLFVAAAPIGLAGTTPARYLAFKHEVVSIRNGQGVPKAWISRRVGGDQIDYVDEKPEIRTMFAQELAKNGLTPKMDGAYQAELVELPAKVA